MSCAPGGILLRQQRSLGGVYDHHHQVAAVTDGRTAPRGVGKRGLLGDVAGFVLLVMFAVGRRKAPARPAAAPAAAGPPSAEALRESQGDKERYHRTA